MIAEITQLVATLPRAESRVADYVIKHTHSILSLTLAELANKAEVSEPSVIRFCRRFGLSGYSDFKLELAKSLGNEINQVHADVSSDDSMQQITQKIFGRSIQELKRSNDNLNPAILKQVVAAMAQALRVEFYGIGASGYVIADVQNKFFRLGLPCLAYSDLPTIKQATAIADESYCCVFVSKTGSSETLADTCEIANKNGAQTIALTASDSRLANSADIHLSLDVNEDTGAYTPMSSRLAQLVVLDVLQVSLALEMGQEASKKLHLTKQALI